MNKYLIEIGTEELPYKFIATAVTQLKDGLGKSLEENKIKFDSIKTFATPRRMTLLVENIALKQDDIQKTIKGPISNIAYDENRNLTKAAEGFAKKNNVAPEALFEKDNYVWANVEQKGKESKAILQQVIPELVMKLRGSHFMRWADLDVKFQRPIRWIVSIFNNEKLEIQIADIVSSNVSRGHRFSDKTSVVIDSPDKYEAVLESAHVIVDAEKRKKKIVESATKKAQEIRADVAIEDELLEEVTYLTEWPVPVVCDFEEKYLNIPDKVTVTVMATHQRYFPLYKDGKLLNKFITMANYVGDAIDNIKAGNERVVTARLEDAIFFFDEDTKKSLVDYVEDLKGVTFQKGLGSVYDKTQRIVKLSKSIADELKINSDTIARTALLCKADLVTSLVFEFTELQGFIGSDYAKISGEKQEVVDGIKEHYYPLNADAEIAKSIEGQVVGIADKVDTVVAVFSEGKKISGSQDPLGVRRATLGVLKTIILNNLDINLDELIKKSIDLMPIEIEDKDKLYKTIKEFFEQRLIVLYSDNYKHDVIESCLNKNVLADLKDFVQRLQIVSALVEKENYGSFHEAVNRVIRIIKDNESHELPNESLFNTQQENALWEYIKSIDTDKISYSELTVALENSITSINDFFDKVLVMDKDENIKQNRINLLSQTKKKFASIADFSKIVH
ncbi:MAG: glycine--tRNA ligase subunit beta [Candidatus Gastranaerophilales bacterium]|nr:glycine--tRNA ligase subunit beta [Candidatus Gastranaerophilales bacterium]